ncbi:hypothetical protein HYT23_05520 [Candidatus Pacearchaeota archaeon]|nr:hypothetical protein [Candidatus Pacearchaeota archaeon]
MTTNTLIQKYNFLGHIIHQPQSSPDKRAQLDELIGTNWKRNSRNES